MTRRKRKIPDSLGFWLDPARTKDLRANADGTFASHAVSDADVLTPTGTLYGEPETAAVEEALVAVTRAEKRLTRSHEMKQNALQERAIAIENVEALMKALERFQKTGEIDDRLYPTFDRAIKRELMKDQHKARLKLKKNIPTALYMGIRHGDFIVHKVSVDQTYEYFTVARRRKNPLTENQLRDRAMEHMKMLMKVSSAGPDEERLARALAVAHANIMNFWPQPARIEPEPDLTSDTREALLNAVGELEVNHANDNITEGGPAGATEIEAK